MDLQTTQGEGSLSSSETCVRKFGCYGELHRKEHRWRAISFVCQADQMLALEQRHPQLSGQRRDARGWIVPLSTQGLHAGQQAIHQTIEHCVAIADMPVDRGDGHAEVFRESTHGERIDSMTFDDSASGAQHVIGCDR